MKPKMKVETERKMKSQKSWEWALRAKSVDLKHGNGASISGRESGLTSKTTNLYLYDIALALTEGDLGEAGLGMLKDGILRLFA
jgi:hypothetical protein